jgi:uncharacterized protein (TIGR03382 family)
MSPAALGSFTFSDGTFNTGDWSQTSFQYGPNGGSGSPSQVLSGGNPGAARYITNSCGSFFSGALNAQYYEAFSYNPAVDGPLSALTFSIDSRFEDGLQAVSFVVRQGGSTWQAGYFLNTSQWATYSMSPAANDWFAMTGASVPTPAPDFSASGAPITFGFWTGNGTAGGFGYSRSGWFDNFTVSFIPTPGATSAALLGVALLGRRRR